MQVSVEIDQELLEQAMLLSRAENVSELLQHAVVVQSKLVMLHYNDR